MMYFSIFVVVSILKLAIYRLSDKDVFFFRKTTFGKSAL